ncbi:LPS assembly lipoprotein LptE [Coralloluteibacterium stylophorae]|uniref:LPS-assembly lipoprotein LptE n=1 Tax=Coralloluteibacterium stylophorae TaxID=1776034 RepID=A0A8J7VSS9_9GAMM|nr:LPS assembly lipoprotein LptE [Coralloluteibacterium stylophorae]MBS7456236.1 hypothetical protein [Coralloluteibacterium stylophorae]
MRRTLLASVLLAVALSLLPGCGFHRRGALVMPAGLEPIRVVSNTEYSPVATGVERALRRQGIAIADAAASDVAILNIGRERFGQGPIMAENRSRTQEYVATYRVTIRLRAADGTIVVPEQTVSLDREYVVDTRLPIGTPAEQDLLEEELRRDMVDAVLRRIDAALR